MVLVFCGAFSRLETAFKIKSHKYTIVVLFLVYITCLKLLTFEIAELFKCLILRAEYFVQHKRKWLRILKKKASSRGLLPNTTSFDFNLDDPSRERVNV